MATPGGPRPCSTALAPRTGDGIQPPSGLVMDTKGNLYGTAEFGGANQTGTVFELSPAAGDGLTGIVIHTFGPSGKGDGRFPAPDLAVDAPREHVRDHSRRGCRGCHG
jgi:uncharacterized repeat protein (TIGR03803 family)